MSSLLADLAELAHSESVVVIADNYERRGCIGDRVENVGVRVTP